MSVHRVSEKATDHQKLNWQARVQSPIPNEVPWLGVLSLIGHLPHVSAGDSDVSVAAAREIIFSPTEILFQLHYHASYVVLIHSTIMISHTEAFSDFEIQSSHGNSNAGKCNSYFYIMRWNLKLFLFDQG